MQQPKKLTKKEKFQQSHEVAKTNGSQKSKKNKSMWWVYLLIAITVFLLYGNSLSNGYVLDDFSVIKENNIVNQGVKNLGQIFKTSYRTGYLNVNDGLYRPLSLAMFAFEWSISPNNPALGHFINLLIYILCGAILFKTLRRLLPELQTFIIIGTVLLFVAHPIHTEVVGNIKSRDELLCFLFSFLSIYCLLKYIDGGKTIQLVVSSLSLFLAFLAKESAILTIPILFLMLYFFRKDSLKNALGIAVSMLVPFVVYMLIRKGVLDSFAGLQSVTMIDNPIGTQTNFGLKLMGSMQVLGEYFQLFIFPHPLIYDYSYNSTPLENGINTSMMIGIGAVLAMILVMIFTFKKYPIISFAIAFIFAALSLYTNIFFTIGAAKAERFTFLASLGFCLALAFVLANILKLDIKNNNENQVVKPSNKYFMVLGAIMLLYSIKTISRNSDWKDNVTLYTHDVDLNPSSAKTHYYLGNELIKKIAEEETDTIKKIAILNKGIEEVKKSVAIFPTYSDGYTQIGVGFYKMNNMDSAVVYFNKGLEYNPTNSVALSNLGAYYFNKRRYAEAIEIYKQTLRLNPRFIDAMLNMGSCYGASGQFNDAIIWFTKAYELDPNNKKAISFLAVTYQNMKQPDKAAYYQGLLR
jgi:tetratricopeptide (TPR) repeat protein